MISGWVVALLALACTACWPGDTRPRSAVRAEPIAGATLGLPDFLRIEAAVRLPAGMWPWRYGSRAGGGHLAFGLVPDGMDPFDGEQPADQFGRYAVVDLKTNNIDVRRTVVRGASSTANVVLDTGTGEHLVRVESWPEAEPDKTCPDNPQYCWSWAVFARALPDGKDVEVDRSRAPGVQFIVPDPVVTADAVLWQSISETESRVIRWSPDGGTTKLGGDDLPPGSLTAADDAWIGSSPRFGHQLIRVPLDGSAPAALNLPERAAYAAVRGRHFAYRNELPESGVELLLGDLNDPGKAVPIHRVTDIYWLLWVSDDALLIATPQGVRLVRTDHTWSTVPVDNRFAAHNDRDRVTFLLDSGERRTIVVAHVEADR
ncbi:hypothetical protein AB0C02_26030 [Micromonospora sp. NPDC048999]|uniref:hypothetical protein n=1 Tax=Micromonospora sp. NPDC048999 TaxID=3155391 RepID=UPI00340D80E1